MTDQDTLAFFKDPDASSVISLKQNQIAAPTVRGKDISIEEMSMGGGVRVVMYLFDRSPSMKSVEALFIEGVNEEMIPAIKEAKGDDISVLRMGSLSFSTDITPIWRNSDDEYFHPLDDLPKLKKSEFDCDKGFGTALHASIIEGYARAVKYANKIKTDSGNQPEIDIIVLTDGLNNERPNDPAEVAQIITGSKKELVRFTFLYFETSWGSDDPEKTALEMGFDGENIMIFTKRNGENKEEYRSRFRKMMRVMSKVSASKGTSAVNAAAAVMATTSNKVDDEDEDIL